MKFQPGQSGNPAGRPKGSTKASKIYGRIGGDLDDIISALVRAAKDGDTAAAKLLLDRAIPSIKPMQQSTIVGDLRGKTLSEQGDAIVQAMGSGKVSSDQAQQMLAGIASAAKIKEADELERRIAALESHDD